MSFFNKIFGNSGEQNPEVKFWNYIQSEEDLNKVTEESFKKKIVIFKHSTRCHISKIVLKNFENQVENSDKEAEYYFLDLLTYRNLSNKIAETFGVEHQSPQLIILENGKAVKNASHQSISLSLV